MPALQPVAEPVPPAGLLRALPPVLCLRIVPRIEESIRIAGLP